MQLKVVTCPCSEWLNTLAAAFNTAVEADLICNFCAIYAVCILENTKHNENEIYYMYVLYIYIYIYIFFFFVVTFLPFKNVKNISL